MTSNYYKPWISDDEPRPPRDWGLDTYRGKVPLTCLGCGKPLVVYQDQYLYKFTPEGTQIYHNSKECFDGE